MIDAPPASSPPGPSPQPQRHRLSWVELLAGVVYVAAVAGYVVVARPHVHTLTLFLAVMLALLVPTIRRPRVWLRGLAIDWLPLLVILMAYDWLRNRADEFNTDVHLDPQLRIDQLLGAGQPLSVRLQQWFWTGSPQWWDIVAAGVYLSHFVVTMLILAVLWVLDAERFRRLRQLVLTMVALAFVTYFAYPAAPPWCVASEGRSAPLTRLVFATLHFAQFGDCRAGNPDDLANPVAALPSLHASLPLLLCVFFWSGARRWVRVLLVLYVGAMATTLIYGAEHFLFDELLGYAYVAAAFLAWRRRWARQDELSALTRAAVPPAVPPTPATSTPG